MSSWAARLCASCGRRDTVVLPQKSSMSDSPAAYPSPIVSMKKVSHTSTLVHCGGGGSTCDEEQCVASAVAQVYNAEEVVALRLPVDCWELVTAYLCCADVARMTTTCHMLRNMLRNREGVWREQMRHFRSDMRDLRGGSLLLTCLAVPPETAGGSYWQLTKERYLYRLDAQREWHFNDVSSLEDAATGIFTVALQLRATTAVDGSGWEAGYAAATLTSPPIGHPYQLEHVVVPKLHIMRPVRQLARCAEPRYQFSPRQSVASQQLLNFNFQSGVVEDDNVTSQYTTELSRADETADDVCTIRSTSQLEGVAGYSDVSISAVNDSTTTAAMLPRPFISENVSENTSSFASPSRKWRHLHVHELMTLVDLLATGNTGTSRVQLEKVTETESALFCDALAQTLQAAMRRRLHLGNHHRALRNDGQSSRHRRGHGGRSTTTDMVQSQLPSLYTNGRLPPVNRILHNFRGQLLEITQREAEEVCTVLLGQPTILRDFVLPPPTNTLASLSCPARFFLAPELCTDGIVGLFVVDLVRLLVIVQPEVADALHKKKVLHVMPNGRVAAQRVRLNEQPVTRAELWDDELIV